MTKRQAITERMKIDCLLIRGTHTCGICGTKLFWGDALEWDHVQAIVHEGEHSAWDIRPVHPACHKEKTKRDVAANAKVKRLRGETCQGPKKKIQSPGFDKTKTRKFNGQVIAR